MGCSGFACLQAVTLGNSSSWRGRPSPTQAPANATRLLAGRIRSQVSEAGHGRARRRIERAVDLVVLLVDLRPVCIGFGNLLSQSHNGSRLALVGDGPAYGGAVDVGLELTPHNVPRPAACGPHVLDGYADPAHNLQRVA